MKFSDWLRSAMAAGGLTQVDVAEGVGASQQAVSRWLNADVQSVDLRYLVGLSRLFGISVEELEAIIERGAPVRANAHGPTMAERVAALEAEVAALKKRR